MTVNVVTFYTQSIIERSCLAENAVKPSLSRTPEEKTYNIPRGRHRFQVPSQHQQHKGEYTCDFDISFVCDGSSPPPPLESLAPGIQPSLSGRQAATSGAPPIQMVRNGGRQRLWRDLTCMQDQLNMIKHCVPKLHTDAQANKIERSFAVHIEHLPYSRLKTLV